MASGILKNDDIAYNAENGAPWHTLGIPIDGLMTADDIRTAVPQWSAPVLKVPAEYLGAPVPGHYFTVKNGEVLGHAGEEYQVVQDDLMLDMAEAICQDKHGPLFETAGLLWGGRKSFLLAKFPEDMVLKGRNGFEDRVARYLLFANAHDSSHRVRILETPVRVVCQNTQTMAFAGKDANTSCWFAHSGDVRAKFDRVADVLGIAAKNFAETQELYQALMVAEPTAQQVEDVLKRLIPDTATKRAELQRERVTVLAENGMGNAPFAGTAWALYNGFTELSDHHNNAGSKREDAQDMRVNSNWFGSGANFKANALKTIADICLN